MATAAQMRTRMEQALRNNDEVFSFAPNPYPGCRNRWYFFLDQHLPFPFEACIWKASSSRIHVWVAPRGFYDFFNNIHTHQIMRFELTGTEFLGSRLDAVLHEMLQNMKSQLNPYIPLMKQSDTDVTYEQLFNFAVQHIPEREVGPFFENHGVAPDKVNNDG